LRLPQYSIQPLPISMQFPRLKPVLYIDRLVAGMTERSW
jgi:hypothetical protein